ncbi:phr, partial [Symbiodinium pilosum]
MGIPWRGAQEAEMRLQSFLPNLTQYGSGKANDPTLQTNSFLSPYLHYGQVSSLEVALRCRSHAAASGVAPEKAKGLSTGISAFLDELIIRRELAKNFVYYCCRYDSFECLPRWASETLTESQANPRPKLYTLEQLERGETADLYWNLAQWEMVATGHMHNYMRMYWCKQLITWTESPASAYNWAVHLNDKFSLDGRDENGYMGIAWCFGMHDKPFPRRDIFGSVRSMTRSGLEGKFKMAQYRLLVQRKCLQAARAEPRLRAILPAEAIEGGKRGGSLLAFLAAPGAAQAPDQSKTLSAEGEGEVPEGQRTQKRQRSSEPAGANAKTLHRFFPTR